MKAQAVTTSAMAPGPFLTLILSSRQARFEDKVSRHIEDEASRKLSGDTTTLSGAVLRSAEDAAEAQSDQPAMVNLGPMLSGVPTTRLGCAWWGGLTLLKMLRRRTPRRDRHRWQGPTLPPGCVMLVRYVSR
ncbi:MAG: hypothetical protein ABSD63_10400 [Candidatus Korobacteraceae bacterium]|jgi:hypothetical protein